MTREEATLEYLSNLIKSGPFKGKVFLAGGAVRDQMMGMPLKDIDVTVADKDGGIAFAKWITQKLGVYSDSNPVIYPRFGTAKFNLRGAVVNGMDISDIEIESVMTRSEKYEKGSRKPTVKHADLETDVLRRDLTVNSLLQDLSTGEILDLTGKGVQDIRDGIIRTPVDPDITFTDDPLRMLRVVRFATKYGWKIVPEVVEALKKNKDQLANISKERIRDEFSKILVLDNVREGMQLLTYTGMMKHIIPELVPAVGLKQNEYHNEDVFNHILSVVEKTPKDLVARLGALFHDIGKPPTRSVGEDGRVHFYEHERVGAEIADERIRELKFPGAVADTVFNVVRNHMRLKQSGPDGSKASDKVLRKFMVALGDDLDTALAVMDADNKSHDVSVDLPDQISGIKKRMDTLGVSPEKKVTLPISGHDVMQTLGIKPGPAIGKILDKVTDAWMENPNMTRDDALKVVKSLSTPDSLKRSRSLLDDPIRNPQTGNMIKIKTALGYEKNHPVRVSAIQYIKQNSGR